MKKKFFLLPGFLFLAWLGCKQESSPATKPESNTPIAEMVLPPAHDTTLPSGRRNIYLVRSRDQKGMFVERSEFPPGYIGEPHVHNEDLYVTIISGSAKIAFGNKLDTMMQVKNLGPGSFVIIPADQAHYEWFNAKCLMQIEGVGPVSTFYIPKDTTAK